MKKFCLALLLVFALSFAASADVMFTVVDNNWTSGAAGLVTSDASGDLTTTKNVVTGLNSDHYVYSFNNAEGKSRVMLSQYTNGQADTVWIYDPASGDWDDPVEVQWAGMSNRRGVATIGSNLFAIAYDNPTVVKVDMEEEDYSRTASYTYTAAALTSDGYRLHGEAILATGGYIFALFTGEKGTYPNFEYAPSKLVKLDASLNVVDSVDLGKNAVKMAAYGGSIYVCSIGGSQQYGGFNADSALQLVDPDTMAVTDLLKASTMPAGWAYDFHGIVFGGGSAYVLAGAYDSMGYYFEGYIYKATAAQLQAGNIGTEFADTTDNSYMGMGWTWDMQYDAVINKLVCASGMLVMVYDPAGVEDAVEIGATEMGGNLASIGVIVGDQTVPTPPSGDSGGSSGGCNAGISSLLLLTGALVLSVRRKK